MKVTLESIKTEFIQKIQSEDSLDTLQTWFSMYEEARYAASTYSNEPELIKFKKEYEESIFDRLKSKRNS